MQPSGLKEIEAAKADGRWESSYHPQSTAVLPEDFLKLVATHKKAAAFLASLKKSQVYSFIYRLQTAKKPETRERLRQTFFEMLKRGETFH